MITSYSTLVLITGGSSGIGKMMALGFAQNGAKVYIAARKEGQLKEVCVCYVFESGIDIDPDVFFRLSPISIKLHRDLKLIILLPTLAYVLGSSLLLRKF